MKSKWLLKIIMKRKKQWVLLSFFLLTISCEQRIVKYSGLNDLVVGVQQVVLYQNGDFYLELGLGGTEGTYRIKNDTVYLNYDDKPQGWPDKLLMTKDYFMPIDFYNNGRLIKIETHIK